MSDDVEPSVSAKTDADVQTLVIKYPDDDYNSIDVSKLIKTVLARKWSVLAITASFMLAGLIYSFVVTPMYRVEVLLAINEPGSQTNIPSGLDSLASIAGINFDTRSGTNEAVATFSSRVFAEEFITDNNLLPVLFARQWDSSSNRWIDEEVNEGLMLSDGVEYFVEEVRSLDEEASTGLIKLTIKWSDAELATEWAASLVSSINERLRKKEIVGSERRLDFLRSQLEVANLVELRAAISRLIEAEIQSMMMAQVEEEYMFKTIDPARLPVKPFSPKLPYVLLLATVIGVTLAIALIIWFAHPTSFRDELS